MDVPEQYVAESPQLFDDGSIRYWDVSLSEVIHIGLTNSRVLRDLGGRLVTQPGQILTTEIPEIVRSNPANGVEAALSAFDAQLRAGLNYSQTENGLRAPIIGSTIETIQQEKGLGSVGFSKIGQAGTRFSLTHGNLYDADNVGVPPNRFGKAFDTFLNVEGRHPLARGGGRVYNAIAGPAAPFGVYNGYWIAGIKSDIAQDDLQIATRDYIYNIIRGYWLLKFAYDTVESRNRVLDIAQESLSIAEQKYEAGTVNENFLLQAKERYLSARQQYDDALAGPPQRILAGILGPNGSLISGTELGFRSLERRLRLLIGLGHGEGGLLRPIDQPSRAPILFDYHCTVRSAMASRPELRRQMRVIESKRMEWLAARNLRLPSVDLVGNYRVHGFGNSVFGDGSIANDSSMSEFLQGNLQDISGGVEIIRPVGNRLAATAERNAMISISREVAILDQQKLSISHEVNSALAEIERSLRALEVVESRLDVARRSSDNLVTEFETGTPIPIESILESKRVVAELETGCAIAQVDYAIALLGVSLAQGTLLNEVNVYCGQSNYVPSTMPITDEMAKNKNVASPHQVKLQTPAIGGAEESATMQATLGPPMLLADEPQMATVSLQIPEVSTTDEPAAVELAIPSFNDVILR